MKKTKVLGVSVSITSMNALVSEIASAIQNHRKMSIVAINARKIMRARKDEKFFDVLKRFDIHLCDGASLLSALPEKTKRITGVDLMEVVCASCKDIAGRIFFYGATRENNEEMIHRLQQRFPDLVVAGSCDGFDDAHVVDAINASCANIVFVAKGTPDQEMWIDEHIVHTNANIYMGVGGAFDIFSGKIKRSPQWIQNMRMEWFYRMLKDVKRFRQIPELLQFYFLLKKERICKKSGQ